MKIRNKQKIHFVGIGGVSMSSLAVWAKRCGHEVSGSDMQYSDIVKKLINFGINISIGHDINNVKEASLVVYSNATDTSCEVAHAKKLGIKTVSRAQFLAGVLKEYSNTVCVAGAHGKTTTTALVYNVLKTAGKLPSLHLGANLISSGRSYEYSNKDSMVCEACEYKDAFLHFPTSIGVILNIAPEHLDYFKDYNGVLNSFNKFANNSQNLVINYDFFNKNAVFFEHFDKKVLTFGLNYGNFTAKNIVQNNNGTYCFDCYKNDKYYLKIKLNLIGKHNVLNALATIAVCDMLKISKKHICTGLQTFEGVERRFEYLHKDKFLVHDYAHHPDEISATLTETLNFYKHKLLVVFQPHTYSRTKHLMQDFKKCFLKAKEVLILKTYSAREKYDAKGSAKCLANNLGNNAKYIRSFKIAKEYVCDKIKQGYGVLFLGAGDIYSFSKIVAKLCWQDSYNVLDFNPLNIKIYLKWRWNYESWNPTKLPWSYSYLRMW